MKRRDWIAATLSSPGLLVAGCASPPKPTASAGADPAKAQITVLYDAFGMASALRKDWGYAALVEVGGKRILFDTGNNGDTLALNSEALGIDLARLDMVVMSHRHGDHMGGLAHLLSVNPKVPIYAPKEGFGVYGGDLPGSFYRKNESLAPRQRYYDGKPPELMRFGAAWPKADLRLVDKSLEIAKGLQLISLVSDKPGTLELRELSLAIATPQGVVLVVGCSHPGIDRIVDAAAKIDPRVHLIAGGLHLVVSKDEEIDKIIATLRDTYKVGFIAPSHCTGEPAFAALATAYGNRYLYAGLGTTVVLGVTPRALSANGQAAPSALRDDDLQGYQALYAASAERRRGLFADLQGSAAPGGAYLAQWRRSMAGCC
jgi:7,8-dihydropterin-6-yl-methyl-4-(beta-D-ribofuranosyl)aminobenzene 5'-phosphate synthase